MRLTVPQRLLGLMAALVAVNCIWAFLGHFSLDLMGYLKLALMSAGLFAGAAFYSTLRPEPRLAAMLFGAGFICAFSASASLLNYFLLTVAGTPIDPLLVQADRLLGFDWYKVMVGMAAYPLLNEMLFRIYNLVLPQIALLLIALACTGRVGEVYRFCLAIAAGALIAMAIWTVMPSAGANAVHVLPAWVESRLTLSLTTQYGRELLALLHDGPGYITPADMRGLIGFPSYHAVLALLLIWFARPIRWLGWPFLIINILVLISTPVQGGHHLVDVLAALPVAALSLLVAGEFPKISLKLSFLANRMRKLTIKPIPCLLLALVVAIAAIDCVWAFLGGFSLDLKAYLRLALMSAGLFAYAGFYCTVRPDPRLAAMLFGAGFLCAFSAGASVLNYFLLTVAGTPIDPFLVAADRALGFDWYQLMVTMGSYPRLNEVLFHVYNMVLPQMAILLVALAWNGHVDKVYRYCLAVAVGALIAITVWTLIPSLGAKSLYTLPAWVEARLSLSVTTQYGRELLALLHNGPGYITPADMRGLIAFPSYHGVLALLLIWFARPMRWLFWPYLVINTVVLISTPIQGGHHLVDVLAAFPVALLSLALAGELKTISLKSSALVNKVRNFADTPVPQGVFRAGAAQLYANAASIIKSKLSRVT